MNQNSYYAAPYGAQQPMGYPYTYGVQQQAMPMYNQQPAKQPEYTNPLGAAKIKELLEKGNGAPKIQLTEEDFNEAICTHRYNGHLQIYDLQNEKGEWKCKICGAEFVPVDDATVEDVTKATDNLMNIMHTAKIAWLDVPDKSCVEYFQALAVIKKTPELFKIAMNNFNQYNGYQIQNTNNPVNGFGIMNQILGPQGMQPYYNPAPAPAYQQQYAPQYQAPVYGDPNGYYGNPAAQQMQAGAPGVSNGFGYTSPQFADPNTVGQQLQQQPATQAQTPVQKGETVTKQLHV